MATLRFGRCTGEYHAFGVHAILDAAELVDGRLVSGHFTDSDAFVPSGSMATWREQTRHFRQM